MWILAAKLPNSEAALNFAVNFPVDFSRAELKVFEPKVTEPNLRLPAVFCENLRFSAGVIFMGCAAHPDPGAPKGIWPH